MKKCIITLLLFAILILITSCSFYTKGKSIEQYSSPNKALLIIDIQKDFTDTNAKMPVNFDQAKIMIENINSLISKAKNTNLIIIYIKNSFSKNDFIANIFRNFAAIENTKGADFDKRLIVINNQIFNKNQPDAFSNIDFENFLIKNQVNELYITGVFADQCVYWTSKGALNRKYKVIYIKDAVASKTIKEVDNTTENIKKEGAIIKETNDVLK